jgi:DNA-binding response OmpR family regulator
MSFSFKNKRILIIDRQKYWREMLAETLAEGDSQVALLDNYEYQVGGIYFAGEHTPDLVILGCVRVGMEERELIRRILADKLHLMVFSSLLPWEEMRELFSEGADDVADKSYDPDRLISAVEDVLNAQQGDSYQRAGEKGRL